MRKFIKNETGEFAIDAIFGITFFMLSLIAIMFMSLIIRVQSNIQYALGQTAKEISGYYYLVDKMGLAAVTSGSNNNTKDIDVDKTIQNVVDFSGSVGSTSNSVMSINITDAEYQDILDAGDDIGKSVEAFKKVKSSISSLDGNSVTQVIGVFSKTAANKVVSYFIAPMVCERLMPKYLSSKWHANIDEYYDAVGIKNVSFAGSEFLTDNRSIKVQITYELDLERYTLGFVSGSLTFRQVASTAAWVRPDENGNLLPLDKLGY